MNKQKKQYTSPDLEVVNIHFENDILTGSVENFSSYIDGGNGDRDEPIDW